jgi:hypothetical protein
MGHITSKLGQGRGTVVDLRSGDDALLQAAKWLLGSRPGSRLLVRAAKHKQIKQVEKYLRKLGKTEGIRLTMRFQTEKLVTEKYIHPEYIEVIETEPQLWVLVTARAVVGATNSDKNGWLFESICRDLDKQEDWIGADREHPANNGNPYPAWVYEMGPDDRIVFDQEPPTIDDYNDMLAAADEVRGLYAEEVR